LQKIPAGMGGLKGKGRRALEEPELLSGEKVWGESAFNKRVHNWIAQRRERETFGRSRDAIWIEERGGRPSSSRGGKKRTRKTAGGSFRGKMDGARQLKGRSREGEEGRRGIETYRWEWGKRMGSRKGARETHALFSGTERGQNIKKGR